MVSSKRSNNHNIPPFFIICLLICIILFVVYYIKINKIHNMEIDETHKIEKLKKQFKYDLTSKYYPNYSVEYNYNEPTINKEPDDSYIMNNTETESNNNNTTNTNHKKIKKKIYEDCIIEIPDIELSKIVYTGKDREKKLDNYDLITAAPDMKFTNGGNYIICGHASRLYGHSLNRLKEVHKDTLIQIWANNEVKDFKVNKVYYENMDNTNKYCKQTDKNEITIISCAKYISQESYIIIKAIPK